MKIVLFLLLGLLLIGASNCSTYDKYQAKFVEDCAVFTNWDSATQTQKSSCFCIDNRITTEQTFNTFLIKFAKSMSNHPERDTAIEDIKLQKADILKKHEYTAHIQYCKYYRATSPIDRVYLENWAETNRLERIKAEGRRSSSGRANN